MSFIFFIGRAQKIATAIYLITGLFSEKEPLREELRKKALVLVSDMRAISDNKVSNASRILEIRGSLEHALSLSDLASRSGLVSEMNHLFLKAEIESFVGDIETLAAVPQGQSPIAATLEGMTLPTLLPASASSKQKDKGHSKGHAIVSIRQKIQPSFGEFKRTIGPIKDIEPERHEQNGGGKERKEKIHRIIEEKGPLTIKDIASVAPEYSEKTIQRDLVDMVTNGRLKKKGERRWTTYFV